MQIIETFLLQEVVSGLVIWDPIVKEPAKLYCVVR